MNSRLPHLERLIGRLDRRRQRFQVIDRRLLRLRALLLGPITLFLGLALGWGRGLWWLAAGGSLAALLAVAWVHHRVRRRDHRWSRGAELQRQYLARMRLAWNKLPPAAPSAAPSTPLQVDLDLIGSESLLRLLDTALSDGGGDLLRQWLSRQPGAGEPPQRQQLVRELATLQLLRNRLWRRGLASIPGGTRISTHAVTAWSRPASRSAELARGLAISAGLLGAAGLAGVLGWTLGWGRLWLLPLLANFLYLLSQQQRIQSIFQRGVGLESNSSPLRRLFQVLEEHHLPDLPSLRRLLIPLRAGASSPHQVFGRVSRLVSLLSVRAHPLIWGPLNVFFPWDFLFGWRLEQLRTAAAPAIDQWLDVLHRLDAANCLGLFAYLHPEYAFPELRDEASFESHSLGHPLLSPEVRVANDFSISGAGTITLITGSNMAGKSTFLRTVGINLQLAFAGAPVCARAMRTGIFRVFTCIRISDSVTDGYSYFYAEVRRLRELLEELRDEDGPPVMFLIDEIFKGTNNRERLIGSRSFVRTLANSAGLGLITTHDLELTQLAAQLPSLRNLHFREEVKGGQMEFDYRLHEGPCPTTNALKIMQLAGLPVGD